MLREPIREQLKSQSQVVYFLNFVTCIWKVGDRGAVQFMYLLGVFITNTHF